MELGLAIHKALDYFFCDRCITEAELPGRPIEWPDFLIVRIINKICPIQYLFNNLPDEEDTQLRRIYFPRSWMSGTSWHEEEGIRNTEHITETVK